MNPRKRERQEEAAARQAARDERTTVQQLRRLAERNAVGGKEWERLISLLTEAEEDVVIGIVALSQFGE